MSSQTKVKMNFPESGGLLIIKNERHWKCSLILFIASKTRIACHGFHHGQNSLSFLVFILSFISLQSRSGPSFTKIVTIKYQWRTKLFEKSIAAEETSFTAPKVLSSLIIIPSRLIMGLWLTPLPKWLAGRKPRHWNRRFLGLTCASVTRKRSATQWFRNWMVKKE